MGDHRPAAGGRKLRHATRLPDRRLRPRRRARQGGGTRTTARWLWPARRDRDATDPGGVQEGSHYLCRGGKARRSEEHTSELQSLMRISYAVFCLKKKKKKKNKLLHHYILNQHSQNNHERHDNP